MTVQPEREWFEKDYYAALGLAPSADDKAITKTYRKLAKQFHPDANQGSEAAEARFKEISAAYDVLGDAEKRKAYDEVRQMVAQGYGPQHGAPGGFGGAGGPGGPGGFTFEAGDMGSFSDLFSGLFGGGREAGGGFRGRGAGARASRQGRDVEAETNLRFEDAVRGMTATLALRADHPCTACDGTGASQGGRNAAQACPSCFGRGVTHSTRDVTVRIPPGVLDGQRIRVAGKGEPGVGGGPAGDLIVKVNVGTHPQFGRSGKSDLTTTVDISVGQALLGGEVAVPTLSGSVKVRVQPGTASGSTVRVKGHGVTPKHGSPGALLATFRIHVPKDLSPEDRAAIERLLETVPALTRAGPAGS